MRIILFILEETVISFIKNPFIDFLLKKKSTYLFSELFEFLRSIIVASIVIMLINVVCYVLKNKKSEIAVLKYKSKYKRLVIGVLPIYGK